MCRQTQVPQLSFAETVETVFKNGPEGVRGWSTFSRYFVISRFTLELLDYMGTALKE